jgi:hypothetical protein
MEQAFIRTGTAADRPHESNPQTQASIVEDGKLLDPFPYVKCTNILDGDEEIIFEEDEEEDEGYVIAGQGNHVAIYKTRIP